MNKPKTPLTHKDKQSNSNNSQVDSRRNFVLKSFLGLLAGIVGTKFIFANNTIEKSLPKDVLDASIKKTVPGKSAELTVLSDKPWNAETPIHLLDSKVTQSKHFFVRNNGNPPSNIDLSKWRLTIEGESAQKKITLSLKDLKTKFKHYSYNLTMECGGNSRAEFSPTTEGNQWGNGAVGCSKWTGVRLKDVLNYAGVKTDAVYIGYYGADQHLLDPTKVVISRGVPIEKAMEDESLIAWAMNDEDIPLMNGYPLRMVIGGWPASVSGKWLTKIKIRNKIHDGEKMNGKSYRVPKFPVAPGSKVAEEDMEIIGSMPIKSIVTYPRTGAMIAKGKSFEARGHAWAGDLAVKEVHVSIDFGVTWKKSELLPPVNRFAWQQWKTRITLPEKGYYEVWVRATDSNGKTQPMVIPNWNPKGYLNNACHRIAVKQLN
ncbi:MAG: hypothetical protein RI883_1943 [Bacteroidota bacterium]|jgi:DMSO/TMAO reductase YedYZ molybdopterin-dependent catalytic subunit